MDTPDDTPDDPVIVDPPDKTPPNDVPPPTVILDDIEREEFAEWFDVMEAMMRVAKANSAFIDTVKAIGVSVRGKRPMPVVAGVTEGLDDSEDAA